jgi:cytochrome c553
MKYFVFPILILLIYANLANAEEGDAFAGKNKSKFCQGCHGEDGNSVNPLCPNLSGQNKNYLEKQILDFQSGKRTDSIMSGISQGLISEQDAKDIAAYFSSRKPMVGFNGNKLGQNIFREGKPEIQLPSCASCHGENGKGKSDDNITFPIIGGQTRDYISKQLRDLRSGNRHNDSDGMMSFVSKKLTDAEIEALADYVSGL